MKKTENKNIRVANHKKSPLNLTKLLINQDASKRCMIGEVMQIVNSGKHSNDQIITWILKIAKNSCIPRERFIAQFNAFKELKLYLGGLSSEVQKKWNDLIFSKNYVLPRVGGWALIFGTQKQPDLCINVSLSFMSNTGGKKVFSHNDKYNTISKASKKSLSPVNHKVKKSVLSCQRCKINRVPYLKSIKKIKLLYKIKMKKFLSHSKNKPKQRKLPIDSFASYSSISKRFNEIESQIIIRMKALESLKEMMKRKKERSSSLKSHNKREKCDGQVMPFFTMDKSLFSNVGGNASFILKDDKVTKDIELDQRQDASTCLELPQQMLGTGESGYKFSYKSFSIETANFKIIDGTNIYLNIPSNIIDSPRTFNNFVGVPKITCKRIMESTHCSEGLLTKRSKFLSYSNNEVTEIDKSELWFCEYNASENNVENIPKDKAPRQKKKVSFSLKKRIMFEERQNPLLNFANKPLLSSHDKKNELLKSSQPMHLDKHYCKERFESDNTFFENNNVAFFLNSSNSKGKINLISGKHFDSFLPSKRVHFSDNTTEEKSFSNNRPMKKTDELSLQLRTKKLSSTAYDNSNKLEKNYFPKKKKKKKSCKKDIKKLHSKNQKHAANKFVTQSKETSNSYLHKELLADWKGIGYTAKQGSSSETQQSSWDAMWSPLKKELKSLFSLDSKKPCCSKIFSQGLKKCESLYLNLDKFLCEKEFTLNLYKKEVMALQHNLFFLEDILKEKGAKNKYQKNGEPSSLKDCVADEVDNHSSFQCGQRNVVSLSDYQHNFANMAKSCGNTKVTKYAKSEILGSSIKRIKKNVCSQISNNHQTIGLSYKLEVQNEHYASDKKISGCQSFRKGTKLLTSDKDLTFIEKESIGEIEHLQMLDLLSERDKLTQRLNKYQLLISNISEANNSFRQCLALKGDVDLFNNPSLKDEIKHLKRLVDDQRHLQSRLKDCEEKLNSKKEENLKLELKLITEENQNLLSERENQILKIKINVVENDCKKVKQLLSEKEAQLFQSDTFIKCEIEHQKSEIEKYKKEIKKLVHEQSNIQLYINCVNEANTAVKNCLSLHCSNNRLLGENLSSTKSLKVNQKVSQEDCQESWLLLAEIYFELDENCNGNPKMKILKEELIVFNENLRKLLCNYKFIMSHITKVTGTLKQWIGLEHSNNLFDMPFLEEEITALNYLFEDWQQQKHIVITLQEKLNDMQQEISIAKDSIFSGLLSNNLLEKELLTLNDKHKALLLEKEADSKEKILLVQERKQHESQSLEKMKELQNLLEQLDKNKLIVASFTKSSNEIRKCLELPGDISLLCNSLQMNEVAKLKSICNELNYQKSLVVTLEENLETQKNKETIFEAKLDCVLNKQVSVEKELLYYKDVCIKQEKESCLQIIEIQNLKGEVNKFKSIIASITDACYTVKEYLGLGGAVNLYENPSLSEEISELKKIMVWYKSNLKTVSVKKQQINKLLSSISGVNKSKSVIKRQTKKQITGKILLLKNNQLSLQNEIKMLNESQLNCNIFKANVDHKCSHKDLILETVVGKEKLAKLQNSIAEEQNLNTNLNLEIAELKSKVSELSSLLKQEHNEASRQLELQLAMYCATAERYREQKCRIEESFNAI